MYCSSRPAAAQVVVAGAAVVVAMFDLVENMDVDGIETTSAGR